MWSQVTLTYQKGGGGVVTAQGAQGKAEARGPAAQAFLKTLSEEQRTRLDKKGQLAGVSVVVLVEGNRRVLLRLG
ncbi:hypothetical protein [Nitrospira sp. Kam-Ns4a]